MLKCIFSVLGILFSYYFKKISFHLNAQEGIIFVHPLRTEVLGPSKFLCKEPREIVASRILRQLQFSAPV